MDISHALPTEAVRAGYTLQLFNTDVAEYAVLRDRYGIDVHRWGHEPSLGEVLEAWAAIKQADLPADPATINLLGGQLYTIRRNGQ